MISECNFDLTLVITHIPFMVALQREQTASFLVSTSEDLDAGLDQYCIDLLITVSEGHFL